MGVTVEPVFARISRWARSMAQYTVITSGASKRSKRDSAPSRACTWRATLTTGSACRIA